MDRFQKKVIFESSSAPETSVPVAVGIFALLAGLMFGAGPFLTLAGLLAAMVGIGFFVRKMIFGFSRLTQSAYEAFFESRQARQDRALRELDRQLQRDHDPRTHNLLRQMWHLYKTLEKDVESGKIAYGSHEVLEKVDDMFQVCVEHLKLSYQLWEMARRLGGYAERQKLQQREELIQEVHASVDHLEKVVEQLHERTVERNASELKKLREELDETMRVAKAVEERTADLDGPSKIFEIAE